MYTVIRDFVDLKDNRHKYAAGDVFPHHGEVVDKDRIKELSGYNNMAHTPLIRRDTKGDSLVPKKDALGEGSVVSTTSSPKRKERPRRKQGKNDRADP